LRAGGQQGQNDSSGAASAAALEATLASISGSAQLFDAEHAGDGPAVAGRPPSSPADHAAPARSLVSTRGALAGPPALRGWRLGATGREHL